MVQQLGQTKRIRVVFRLTALTIAIMSGTGCAGSGLRVESFPAGAEVTVAVVGQPARKVGVTPIDLNEYSGPDAEPIQVTAAIKGRQSQSAYVPASRFAKRGQLFFQLDEVEVPPACQNVQVSFQKIAFGVAQAQAQIAAKNLDQAITLLNSLVAEFSEVSVLYDLLGNAYYLKKDLDSALANYTRSKSINSENKSTERMIKKILSLRGSGQ